MNNPPGRGTMWRVGFSTPPDYNDHQVYCGGLKNLWDVNDGKCGVCGDPFQEAQPRDHEAGGKYGKGIIVRRYQKGQKITVEIEITANHKGHFEFNICPTNNPKFPATDACMNGYRLKTSSGHLKYYLNGDEGRVFVDVILPADLTCSLCVFRWKYFAAQNIGFGERQEHFYSCADVAIESGDVLPPVITNPPVIVTNPPVIVTNPPVIVTNRPVIPTQAPVVTTRPSPIPPNLPKCPISCKFYCQNLNYCYFDECKNCIQ
ncbi:hypothetical protein SNE40_007099 [Patella caerulea]